MVRLLPAKQPGRLFRGSVVRSLRDRIAGIVLSICSICFGAAGALADAGQCRATSFAFFDSLHSPARDLSIDGTWQLLNSPGVGSDIPGKRVGHSAILDPVRNRMVVFGGRSSYLDYNDVWALSLSGDPVWTLLVPSGASPPGRTRGA